MDEQGFKKILEETIAPLRSDIQLLKNDVNDLKDIQENRLLPSVTETETTVKSYADSYKENKRNIYRLDDRLTAVEDELDIESPEDLKVPHFAE